MEAEEEESEDEDEPEYDEHVWLSLKNAETLCNAITDALEEIDPANKDAYAANAASYLESWPLWMANIRRWWTMPPGKPCCSATVSRSAIWWTIMV